MSEPLRQTYSYEEALAVAKQWMRDTYGTARELPEESRDRYHEKLGFLVDFLHTLHPSSNS